MEFDEENEGTGIPILVQGTGDEFAIRDLAEKLRSFTGSYWGNPVRREQTERGAEKAPEYGEGRECLDFYTRQCCSMTASNARCLA